MEGELEEEYIYRICSLKDVIGTWNDVAVLLNNELGHEFTESKYRKQFQAFEKMFSANQERFADDNVIDEMVELKYEIQQERVKFRDERTYVSRLIREAARIDSLKETVSEFSDNMSKVFPMVHANPSVVSWGSGFKKRTGILNLSDWHFGLEIDNFLNKYNSAVFKERINKLVREVIWQINFFKLEKLCVVGLGDYISGLIHNIIRIENREDVVMQSMTVAETLAEMLDKFSNPLEDIYIPIDYYDVLDNHSRVTQNKKESLPSESFSLIIRWHLENRFANSSLVTIHENEFDNEICTFDVYGYKYLGVHGHNDKITNVVQDMSLMTKRFYDCVFMAHKHHLITDETHSCYIYSNPCLSGVDLHSKTLRLTSNPAQNLFIVSEDDPIEFVRTIKLS